MRRVLAIVMDGVGASDKNFGNAVTLAKTPTLDALREIALHTTLMAHGTAVGMPTDGDIGNSEVGHNAIGAGRIFDQGAKLVENAITEGFMYDGETWKELCEHVKQNGSTLHLLGLLSDGNVHSNESHLHAMIRRAKVEGIKKVRVHALFDGRDVGEKSAEIYIERLNKVLAETNGDGFDVCVASGGGRMLITMDRYEADWSMVKNGWYTHVLGKGKEFNSYTDAIAKAREDDSIVDQYIPAFVVTKDGQPVGEIVDGDGVILFNFRGDRAIEITRAFTEESFAAFDRVRVPKVYYAGIMEYDADLSIPPKYLVSPPVIKGTLSEYLLEKGLKLFACSETQKFGHVTYFWNGNRSGYINKDLEEYVEVPSDSGITFDERPEMKAKEIADVAIDRMKKKTFDFGRINFANGDMVGHTGDLDAAVASVEEVDAQIKRLVEVAKETETLLLITADHGNADEMFDAKEKDFPGWETLPKNKRPTPKTAHTKSPVPLYIYDPVGQDGYLLADVERRTLGNIANTVCDMMGVPANSKYLPSLLKSVRKA